MMYLAMTFIALTIQLVTMTSVKVCQYYRKYHYKRRKQRATDLQTVIRRMTLIDHKINHLSKTTYRDLSTIIARTRVLLRNTSTKTARTVQPKTKGGIVNTDTDRTVGDTTVNQDGHMVGNGARNGADSKQKGQKPTRWNVEVKPFQPSDNIQSCRIQRDATNLGNSCNISNIAEATRARQQMYQNINPNYQHVN